MARLKPHAIFASLLKDDAPSPALTKQSLYGTDPWRPGEIPTRGTMRNSVPHDDINQPYGESMGVQKPRSRGKGYRKDES